MKKTYSLIAVDDEAPSLELTEWFCKRLPEIVFSGGFPGADAALEFLRNHTADIVLLDIEMAGMNGLDFARRSGRDTKIIFATAHRQFALEGFDLSAVDYLLKPYSAERFANAIRKAIAQLEMEAWKERNEAVLRIKVNYSNRTIPLKDILLLESLNNNIHLSMTGGETLVFRESLKHIMEQLPENRFVRIHRSYVVNISAVTAYGKQRVVVNARELPVSSAFRENFLRNMKSGS